MQKFPSIDNLFKRDETGKRLTSDLSHPAFAYLKDATWVFTEKVDGTNIRVIYDGAGNVEFRGRTDDASLYPKLVEALKALFPAEKLTAKFDSTPVCLYGEGYGAKIQGGGKYRPDQGFILFDAYVRGRACAACSNELAHPSGQSGVFCSCRYYWLERPNVEDLAESLGCEVVPIVREGPLRHGVFEVKLGLDSLVAQRHTGGKVEAEGLIGRPKINLFDQNGNRIQVKIKARDYR